MAQLVFHAGKLLLPQVGGSNKFPHLLKSPLTQRRAEGVQDRERCWALPRVTESFE